MITVTTYARVLEKGFIPLTFTVIDLQPIPNESNGFSLLENG